MTCKYFDSGWCYAPENVKNNSVQGGCFEPEYCATYLMQNKTLMTEKEHLECEIKELELEIEERNKSIQNLINVQNRRKQKLEELERQKPITLQRIIEECMVGRNREIQLDLVENILDRVEVEFFPKLGSIEPPLYNDGWEDCLKEMKGRLRE
jgi:chromosome segregation ATPase